MQNCISIYKNRIIAYGAKCLVYSARFVALSKDGKFYCYGNDHKWWEFTKNKKLRVTRKTFRKTFDNTALVKKQFHERNKE